ncbi:ECF transporter S component (folate family) [Bacilli bacterium PM5-3]|nr:ECF transporter S component (folate family) [Bacilli bacterium PM5-3]MDH6603866.1 ECF transporter S component (folate family) [Bacilli bacterium PM5-9]
MNLEIIIAQIIVLIVMVALFYVTFKKDGNKITIKDMTIVTLMCVLTAVLNKTLSIKFPPAQPIFVISFASSIAITLGILFSPKLALIAGLITDIVGLLLAPASGDNSMPFLGFTLTAMLSCYLPSILVRVTKKQKEAVMNLLIVGILLLSVILAGVYLFSVNTISIDQNQNDLNNSLRYSIIGVLVLISIAVVALNYFINQKIKNDSNMYITTTQLTLIVLVVEIVCHIVLTTLWINIMYGVPLVVAASTRIIKGLLMLPLNVMVIYLILKYIPNQYKRHLIKEEI